MKMFMTNRELPSRIRFMLQDIIELRENNWMPRKSMIDNGPRTIQQVRDEAAKVHSTLVCSVFVCSSLVAKNLVS